MSTWNDEKHVWARLQLLEHGRLWDLYDESLSREENDFVSEAPELLHDALDEIERLRDEITAGDASDGYHTHNELYRYRMLYNAHAARGWVAQGIPVVKSWRHEDGELCFGGDWFIVTATLPTGQVSNHYEEKYWDLFDVPIRVYPPVWDGHTPEDAANRLEAALNSKENES